MTKQKLVKYLIKVQKDLQLKFEEDVCENWSLEGFLEFLEECITEIQEESEDEEDD